MVLTERWSRREALRGREGAAEQNGRGDPTAPPEGDAENDGGGHAFSVEQRRKEREKNTCRPDLQQPAPDRRYFRNYTARPGPM
jgi:hypothetical protein